MDVDVVGSVNIRECPYTFRKLVDANLKQKAFGLGNVVVDHGIDSLVIFGAPLPMSLLTRDLPSMCTNRVDRSPLSLRIGVVFEASQARRREDGCP